MFSPGRIQDLIDSGVLQKVLDDAGVQKNTDPQYQQPAGPNSIVPDRPFLRGLTPGGGAAAAGGLPTAAQGSGLPPATAGATPTPGMPAGGGFFAKPTKFTPSGPPPGSLGDMFKNMLMQRFEPKSNRVEEYNRPTPVNPSDQYFSPTDLLTGSTPFGNRSQEDQNSTTINKFLSSGMSSRGGIADLLKAFGI